MLTLRRVTKFSFGLTAALAAMVTLNPTKPSAVIASAAAHEANHGDKTVVMKLATPTFNDVQHEWMKRFAATIETKSQARIKAEIYPASMLGAIPRMIEGTRLGSIQLVVLPPKFFVGVDPRFATLWPIFTGETSNDAPSTSWCSAELMPLATAYVDDAVGLRLLQQADLLAKQQEDLSTGGCGLLQPLPSVT
jgi:hypothetical protein